MGEGYVVISPCRNEEEYMRQTLDSVIAQTVTPNLWVIVDDGSTDTTPELLEEYAAEHEWIKVIRREDRGFRAVGPGVIDAFYAGYESIETNEFEFICKLDLDLNIPPAYFETMIKMMRDNPRVGTCSGKSLIEEKGALVDERKGDDMSLGMIKFYRLSCFEEIGGFVREVMWDGIDCHRCRMNGWAAFSWSDEAINFVHLRPMGTSQNGIMTGRKRHGFGQYFMGTGPIYMLMSALFRINEKPYVIGSVAMFYGWLESAIKKKNRYEDLEFRAFLRRYQWLTIFRGKTRAIAALHAEKNIPEIVF